MNNNEKIDDIKKIKKNINYFQYITDIDSYILDYLFILKKKNEKNIKEELIIDSWYLMIFRNLIEKSDKKNIEIIAENIDHKYERFIYKGFRSKYNIQTRNLLYIIQNWDKLPKNLVFINEKHYLNKDNLPIELYLVPKNNIDITMNNSHLIMLQNNKIKYTNHEKREILRRAKLPFKEWWKKYLMKTMPIVLKCCPNEIFSVSRKKIYEKNKDFFINLYNCIAYDPFCEEKLYVKYCWFYIFN